MHNIPAFAAEKEKRSGKNFIYLLEVEYDTGLYLRYVRYDRPNAPLTTSAGQWNPRAVTPTNSAPVIFEGVAWSPFPFSKPAKSETASGEIPVLDIAVSGVGREIASILEFHDIEQRPGRIIKVHPDMLGDPTAKKESKFIVKSARVMQNTAILTVTPLIFDPLTTTIPRKKVSAMEFPGIMGAGSQFR